VSKVAGRIARRPRDNATTYLAEHVDVVVSAIRQSRALLTRSRDAWETTAWVRSMADAITLSQALREAVFRETEQMEGGTDVCVGVVRRVPDPAAPGIRWGVLVRLARP